jgi:nucleoside-diphosphate-sugar epimerase
MKNRKILVTGGAGFIGSHLTKRLLAMGAEVAVTVKYRSIIDNVRIAPVWDQVDVLEADLRNADSLRQCADRSFDCIFHLAAYNHVGDSFLHVNEALQSNLVATANLMEMVPDFDRFIYMSTSESYGYQEQVPFAEEAVPFPISPYAVGKYAGECYAKMKRHQTKKDIVCVRPFNTFGPYQSERAVIPELIIRCLRGLPVETTEGKQTREFNYVDNIVDGLLAAATVDTAPEELINIGAQEEIAICDLVRKIHQMSGSESELRIGALPDRPTEIMRMSAANERAGNLLGWTPRISFEEGLDKTIDWFRSYREVFYDGTSPLNLL